mmetsp:Transcript_33797/g.6115  ORF Transcript_33797/g.6115 Transcript_33797/m.6115 type:complete len:98 (+) Transcript_33797:2507-2800(+)
MIITPTKQLFTEPKNFAPLFFKGSVGLFKHTIAGVFKSTGNVASSLGNGFAFLSFDNQFQQKLRVYKSQRYKGLHYNLLTGFKQISYGVIGGIFGIF